MSNDVSSLLVKVRGLDHERTKGREGTKREEHEADAPHMSKDPSRSSCFAISCYFALSWSTAPRNAPCNSVWNRCSAWRKGEFGPRTHEGTRRHETRMHEGDAPHMGGYSSRSSCFVISWPFARSWSKLHRPSKRPMQQRLEQMLRLAQGFTLLGTQLLMLARNGRKTFLLRKWWLD